MIRSLYMVELTVADWPAAVAWYRDTLGLEVQLLDEAHRFALLKAGSARVALKEGQPEPGSVLLTFEVADLPTVLERLIAPGVEVESPITDSAEGYRRAIIRDREGYRLCLFAWRS